MPRQPGQTKITQADILEFRRLRAAGLTMRQIAHETGWSHTSIEEYLAGRRSIRQQSAKSKSVKKSVEECVGCRALRQLVLAGRENPSECPVCGKWIES